MLTISKGLAEKLGQPGVQVFKLFLIVLDLQVSTGGSPSMEHVGIILVVVLGRKGLFCDDIEDLDILVNRFVLGDVNSEGNSQFIGVVDREHRRVDNGHRFEGSRLSCGRECDLSAPAESIGADLFRTTRLEVLGESNQLFNGRRGVRSTSEELLKSLLSFVGGGREVLGRERRIWLEKIGHIYDRLERRSDDICALLGLWKVAEDVVHANYRVVARPARNVDFLEVSD